MSTDPLNMQPKFRVNNDQGFIRSVSLIFYSSSKGYLLCNEMRKGFPNPLIKTLENHLIGGKCDLEDTSPIYSGFREFMEETGYRSSGLITSNSINKVIQDFIDCNVQIWDLCVSPKKKLYNRFYVINIDNNIDSNVRRDLFDFVARWKKSDKFPLESIYWWNPNIILEKPSSLLDSFVKNLPY